MGFGHSQTLDLATQPGCAGLEVENVLGKSTVTSAWASSPMKLLTPRSRGISVWAYTSSFGGGMVAGDETRLDVRLGPAARCFVGTQASTKVYRNPGALPCSHRTHAVLDSDAILVFAPDPVQAFADSSYRQNQEFHLSAGAGLVLVDWFTSGRAACGERWAFNTYESRNHVFIDGRRIFLDSLLLEADAGPLAGSHRMGRFNCLATLVIIGSPLASAAEEMLARVNARTVGKRDAVVVSASPVRDGALLRLAGEEVESVGHELHRQLGVVDAILGDHPWSRKQ